MVIAIVPAAGSGSRMQANQNKLFLPLGSEPIIAHTLKKLVGFGITHFIIPIQDVEREQFQKMVDELNFQEVSFSFVTGGEERQQSIFNALQVVGEEFQFVVVHDGARPFANLETYKRVLKEAQEMGAAIAGVPAKDTVKEVSAFGEVDRTLVRSRVWQIQTPQIFSTCLLKEAHEEAQRQRFVGTDDSSLVENLNHPVAVVLGDYENIKITTPEDMQIGNLFLKHCKEVQMRIGKGFDVHKFSEDRLCILGGVEIPYSKGLLGHSDADVLCHAISDALLGALALGDIGTHFPDSDPHYKGADSIVLLQKVMEMIRAQGFELGNLDATVMAEAPKLMPHMLKIRERLAEALQVEVARVSVKATTTEKLGFVGRGEGIAAEAVVLLTSR